MYTALQFWRAGRWKAGDTAAAIIARLESDDELALACRAIDYGEGPLLVPMRFRPLLVASARAADPQTKEDGATIPHSPEVMRSAMKPDLPSVEDAVLIYRACFDKLFAHLTEANRLLDTGQARRKDLNSLHYWLERIMRYEYPPLGCTSEEMFQPFLRAFGYAELFKLHDRLVY